MVQLNYYQPQVEVTIYTTSGKVYKDDLMNDLVSVHIERSVSGDAGSFGLTLKGREYGGKTWKDIINSMDYVEIRMGNAKSGGKLPIRMRGFVDNAYKTFIMGQDGAPQKGILINGRDYTKLFMVSNIQYLWTINANTHTTAQQLGLSLNYFIDNKINTVPDFVKAIVNNAFNGTSATSDLAFLPNFQKSGVTAKVPKIAVSCSVPSNFAIENITIQPYTGPFWNLLTYFQSPPLGECFMIDNENSPVLIYRVVPFKDANGNFITPAADPAKIINQLGPIDVYESNIVQYNIGKSDNEVFNYFFVYSDIAGNDASTMGSYIAVPADASSAYENMPGPGNPFWVASSVKKYGLRPLNIVSSWVSVLSVSDNSDYVKNAGLLASFTGKVYGHNENLQFGTIIAHGGESYIPGRYLKMHKEGILTFYLESVVDEFQGVGSSNPSWLTTLGVTRGQAK